MKFPRFAILFAFLSIVCVRPAFGQSFTGSSAFSTAPINGFFENWFSMVTDTQSAQPQWITPIATITPRLEQEFRFDVDSTENASGVRTDNIDGAKGLEIIPFRRVEVIFNLPPYLEHNDPKVVDGFGDVSFLVKYRLLAANEEHGNYILSVFLGWSIPTGTYTNGARSSIVTPTIAYGKGFGNFDEQGTFGVTLPTGNENVTGRDYLWNNSFQYHLFQKFWPEVELNYTHFQDGDHNGQTQLFVTPGIMIGRLHLWKRVGFSVGGGFQVAATHFHTTNHNGIFSVRFPF